MLEGMLVWRVWNLIAAPQPTQAGYDRVGRVMCMRMDETVEVDGAVIDGSHGASLQFDCDHGDSTDGVAPLWSHLTKYTPEPHDDRTTRRGE